MYYNLNGIILEVGKQNFASQSVDVTVNGKTTKCQMFSDFEGDIGFYYDEQPIYFQHLMHTI